MNAEMGNKGVITGDIIDSKAIRVEWRPRLLEILQKIAHELEQFSSLQLEFFRGDSFQLIIDNPVEALKIAVLLRAGLQGQTPDESENKWDARVALGIGKIEYAAESVVVSDGEAFHNSGCEFDELGKKRLAVRTPWAEVNDELKVSTAFADDIISGWSVTQAQVIYLTFLHQLPQRQVAACSNRSIQAVSKLLLIGREALIRMYLERYEQVMNIERR